MKTLILIGAAAAALTLSACATPAVYGPARSESGTGFLEQRIESDRWRVSFRGSGADPQARVADLALLRAAELTLQSGYDWFRVENRYTEARGGGARSGLSIGGGSGSFGRSSYGGVGVGVGIPLGGQGPALTETVEFRLGRGARPADRDVYDAREVQNAIRARAGL